MKTKMLLLLGLSFLLVSCKASDTESNSDSGFKKSLTEFANSEMNLFTMTRAGDEVVFNEEELTRLIKSASEIIEEYNLTESVANSRFTEDMAEDFMKMDFYERMIFFENNCSPEFYDLLCDMIVYDEPVAQTKIINSTKLLPNEQFALVAINNINSQLTPMGTPTAQSCLDEKKAAKRRCTRNAIIGGLGSLLLAIPAPWAGAAVGTYVSIDLNQCNNNADNAYDECMLLVNS